MPIPNIDLKLPPVIQAPPAPQWPALGPAEKGALQDRIRRLLKERTALLVDHSRCRTLVKMGVC